MVCRCKMEMLSVNRRVGCGFCTIISCAVPVLGLGPVYIKLLANNFVKIWKLIKGRVILRDLPCDSGVSSVDCILSVSVCCLWCLCVCAVCGACVCVCVYCL
jgi:hypothetical protein